MALSRYALEAEMDIIEALTPPKDWDKNGDEVYCNQARFIGAVDGRWATENNGKERKNALARLVRRGEVVKWSGSGGRSNYALAEEDARASLVIRADVQRHYEESFNEQRQRLGAAMADAQYTDEIVKALHKAGYAIVPSNSIRGSQRYLPRDVA